MGALLLNRYEILKEVGRGGLAQVFSAHDSVRDELVALKVLSANHATNRVVRQRFLQEGRLASSLSHPNICRVFDLHEDDQLVFLSMELLQGMTLRDEMKARQRRKSPYSVQRIRRLFKHMGAALELVHKTSVHRDIKPENIWAGKNGNYKLFDFGIAKHSDYSMTSAGVEIGTAYYMAPEQHKGSPSDARADQYSLAVVLYEMATGNLPTGVCPPPHAARRDFPREFSLAIMKALRQNPAKRFSNIREFAVAAFNIETEKRRKASGG